MSFGTFNVCRSIWEHPEFARGEYSEREAFLWMISVAAWKPCRVRSGRVVVDLDRGQFCHSVRFMADAWGWSKSRVDRFLGRLKNRDMIGTDSGTGQLVITVCNYEKFQSPNEYTGTRAGHDPGHERDTSGTDKNKDKKYKKDNIPARDDPKGVLEPVLGPDLALSVIEHRRRKKAPLNGHSAGLLLKRLCEYHDPIEGAEEMIARGWQGFKAAWMEDGNGKRPDADQRLEASLDFARGLDSERFGNR